MSASDSIGAQSNLVAKGTFHMHDYAGLLGRMARLTPGGENASFDALLPVRGTLSRQVALEDWGDDWLVLSLSAAMSYGGHEHHHVLVRSRWSGVPIGATPCSVFVLLDPRNAALKSALLRSSDFEHASWCQVEVQDAT